MTDIAINHQLYFYQLFRERLGIGKQVSPAQVAEVLEAEDLSPVDVGAASVSELLGALGTFMRVTTYKRGRVVVTLMRSDELDEALDKAASTGTQKASVKGKPWKAKASRMATPTKPAPAPARLQATQAQDDPSPAEEAPHADARLVTSPTAHKGAQRPAAAADADEATAQPPTADVERAALDEDAKKAPDELTTPAGSAEATSPEPTQAPVATQEDDNQEAPAAPDAATPNPRPTRDPLISLTITYDPAGDVSNASVEAAAQNAHAQRGTRRGAYARRGSAYPSDDEHDASAASPTPALRLPARLSDELWCPDEMLLRLCEALPPATDCRAALDAAWHVAAALGPDPRRPITFPLEGADGTLMLTLRRRPPTPSGKRWELAAVEPREPMTSLTDGEA